MDFKNIVILTGAGISRESGLHTFRDPDGIWAKVNLEDVATPRAFARNPARVHDFYNARRRQLLDSSVQPNRAHGALADLERRWQGSVLVITQNIDDLHERAGSQNVIHMHGELLKARCTSCRRVFVWTSDLSTETSCTACRALGCLRPDVVWFDELPYRMDEISEALERSDLFISIGTSGSVYPAAGFCEIARQAGAQTVELNLEPSSGASLFDEARYGPATRIVNQYLGELLSR